MTATKNKIDLMACFEDEEWLKEAIRVEEECGGEVGAGYDLGAGLGRFLQNPSSYVQYSRLRSLVMRQLGDLIEERGCKQEFSTVFSTGKGILERRLQQPAPEIQERLLDAVERDIKARKCSSDPTPMAVKLDVRKVVLEVLTPEDWQQIEASTITQK
ncbi:MULTISPECIES: hypothetical protein [Spirulina sp. CCY15215]|uniref:hypothetical protein n=1 Tax=Spirulina sp. CCY15215 TaxID=2767591 RepID=UPI00195095F9|nr:hypothetical protein [Spirulina major]